MIIKNLYKVISDGSVIFTIDKPSDSNYTINYRLIADEGKLLTLDGGETFTVIDVESPEGWYEITAPEPAEEQVYQEDISPQGDLYTEFLASRGIPSV